jgi:LacI family transcriptional regulator
VPHRVTIADVARLAGVSTMTVSRVINAKSDVGTATRARVEEAIATLEYRPSAMARGLSTRRSKTIGLLVPDITNPFFPAIVRGAEDVAWREGYAVSLSNVVEDVERERAALRHFEGHRVDGLVVCSARLPDDDLAALLRRHPASVLINRGVPDVDRTGIVASSLEVDDARGAQLAVQHLVAGGRRRIGLLAGPGPLGLLAQAPRRLPGGALRGRPRRRRRPDRGRRADGGRRPRRLHRAPGSATPTSTPSSATTT